MTKMLIRVYLSIEIAYLAKLSLHKGIRWQKLVAILECVGCIIANIWMHWRWLCYDVNDKEL